MLAIILTSLFVLLVVTVAVGVFILRSPLFVLLVVAVGLSIFLRRSPKDGFEDAPASGSGAADGTCADGCKTATGCLTTLVPDSQGNMLPAVACEGDPNVTKEECNSCRHCQWCDATQKCVSKALFPLLCPASSSDPSSGSGPANAGSTPILGPGGTQMDPTSAGNSPILGPGGTECRLPATDAAAQAAPEAGAKASTAALLRDIQQIVHNELLQTKGMTTANSQPLFQTASQGKVLVSDDPSLQQGAEMKSTRPTYCPKDMSQYIRKDQIPCWGCTLDY